MFRRRLHNLDNNGAERKHTPKFTPCGDWLLMHCPACGSGCTHIILTQVCRRDREDGQGEQIAVATEKTQVTMKIEALRKDDSRFAGRRDNVNLRFYCEECHAVCALVLTQHKGATLLYSQILSEQHIEAECRYCDYGIPA